MVGVTKAGQGRKRKSNVVQAPDSLEEHDGGDAAADSDAAEARTLSLDTVGGKKSTAGEGRYLV